MARAPGVEEALAPVEGIVSCSRWPSIEQPVRRTSIGCALAGIEPDIGVLAFAFGALVIAIRIKQSPRRALSVVAFLWCLTHAVCSNRCDRLK